MDPTVNAHGAGHKQARIAPAVAAGTSNGARGSVPTTKQINSRRMPHTHRSPAAAILALGASRVDPQDVAQRFAERDARTRLDIRTPGTSLVK
jgi:hypothetical protein